MSSRAIPSVEPGSGQRVESYLSSAISMDTLVTVEVVTADPAAAEAAVGTAFGWFDEVEERCSRFDPSSELSRLSATTNEAVKVSPLLFRAVEFAVAVARASGGAFDPTVGGAMARKDFDTNYRTGVRVSGVSASEATHRDIVLNRDSQTVTLSKPLVLDLGAVAKGLAVDLAAEALRPLEHFAINAGGDLYFGGLSRDGNPWQAGIRDPRIDGGVMDTLRVSGMAICTSGDYERGNAKGHHLLDPSSGESATACASVTVIAPSAMLADALATAAFVLGPRRGMEFLEEHGAEGMAVSRELERFETPGFTRYRI